VTILGQLPSPFHQPPAPGGGIVELVVAAVLFLLGVRSALRWFRTEFRAASSGEAFLYALHVSSRVALWFSFASVFLALGLLDEPSHYRWFALIPIALAGVQLLTGMLLARREPGEQGVSGRPEGKSPAMSSERFTPGPLEPAKEGVSADPVRPQPEAAEVESARLLANDAVEILVPEGYRREQVRRLADTWVALDLGEDLEDFLAWARSEEDPEAPPT
jgi:hypothetical protein